MDLNFRVFRIRRLQPGQLEIALSEESSSLGIMKRLNLKTIAMLFFASFTLSPIASAQRTWDACNPDKIDPRYRETENKWDVGSCKIREFRVLESIPRSGRYNERKDWYDCSYEPIIHHYEGRRLEYVVHLVYQDGNILYHTAKSLIRRDDGDTRLRLQGDYNLEEIKRYRAVVSEACGVALEQVPVTGPQKEIHGSRLNPEKPSTPQKPSRAPQRPAIVQIDYRSNGESAVAQ